MGQACNPPDESLSQAPPPTPQEDQEKLFRDVDPCVVTHVPDNGPFDAFYVFPDCNTCDPVSDAAPGFGKYNGGRWAVIEAFGIETQLTNATDVVAMASSLDDTGHRFVCPLIRIH